MRLSIAVAGDDEEVSVTAAAAAVQAPTKPRLVHE